MCLIEAMIAPRSWRALGVKAHTRKCIGLDRPFFYLPGIVSALGILGLIMTAHANANGSLAASPVIGSAPLIVTFTGTGSGSFEGIMQLDFGDGKTDNSISPIREFRRVHTYTIPGSYTVHLRGGSYGGQHPSLLTILASVTITVQ